MATSYDLIGSRELVQVLSPTSTIPVQVCTIRTKPSGVVADLWVLKETFDSGQAGPQLTTFADNIETIIGQGKATGGSPFTDLDGSGLQEVFVSFTVAYAPPGAAAGPITTDVNVPVGLLSESDAEIGRSLLTQAEAMIEDGWNNLVAAANG